MTVSYAHKVNEHYIGLIILTLSMIGTYTVNYRLSDTFIALFFGMIGYILNRADMPAVPIILGLVLGPIFEARLRNVRFRGFP